MVHATHITCLLNVLTDVPDGFIPSDIATGSPEEKRHWLTEAVSNVVDRFVTFQDISEFVSGVTDKATDLAEQQDRVLCRAAGCGRAFKYEKCRHKHEKQKHGLSAPPEVPKDTGRQSVLLVDHKKEHSEARLAFGFLLADLQDAVKEGDGERLLRLYSVALMLFKAYGHTQYAFSTLLLTVQVNCTLSPRLAHSLTWNRFWNGKGGRGRNVSLDLHLEHLNNFLKSFLTRSGPNLTEQTASRVSRSLGIWKELMDTTDSELEVSRSTGAHHAARQTEDILILVEVFQDAELFKENPGREFSVFPKFRRDLLLKLKQSDLRAWLKSKLKEWQNNPI